MRRVLIVATVVLTAAACARGIIRASPWLDRLAWHASHVLVATEGEEIDGNVKVLEAWKGNVAAGTTLSIPELAAFAPEKERTIATLFPDRPGGVVSGHRMVLFLVRTSAEADGDATEVRWKPAATIGGVRVSVAWLEDGQAYAIRQMLNPGPAEMVPLHMSEAMFRVETLRMNDVRRAFDRAVDLDDTAERARALEPYAWMRRWPEVHASAIRQLIACGQDGYGVLMALLQSHRFSTQYHTMVREIGETGHPAVGPFLTRLVKMDLTYMRRVAPALRETGREYPALENPDAPRFPDRMSRLNYAVYYLRELGYAGCRDAIRELLSFWKAEPLLEEHYGEEIIPNCKAILETPDSAGGT